MTPEEIETQREKHKNKKRATKNQISPEEIETQREKDKNKKR